jgi:hypothetical protein
MDPLFDFSPGISIILSIRNTFINNESGIKESPLTENIQKMGQFEKEVKLFQKD